MKNNSDLQKDVQDAIKWEPLLNAAEIGVTAKDGIVTLTGIVDSYAKKLEAETAAKSVAGVTALVENIEIKFANSWNKTDNEVAAEVVSALKWNWQVPNDCVKVKVETGWVTLEGELPWNYQSDAARDAVKFLNGVKGVTNNIKIKSDSKDAIEKADVEAALNRNWTLGLRDIKVKAHGTKITLNGSVNSWFEKEEAGRIAWNTPGVWTVENDLIVSYEYEFVD